MHKRLFLLASLPLLWSCQPAPDTATQTTPAKPVTPTASAQAPAQNASAALVDIPALLRLSISQVKKKLGHPADDQQADVTDAIHALVYKLGDKELTVDYVVKTGQVLEVSFGYQRDITDFTPLYALGKLSKKEASYSVDSLPSEHAGKFRGIIVSPNPPVEFTAD